MNVKITKEQRLIIRALAESLVKRNDDVENTSETWMDEYDYIRNKKTEEIVGTAWDGCEDLQCLICNEKFFSSRIYKDVCPKCRSTTLARTLVTGDKVAIYEQGVSCVCIQCLAIIGKTEGVVTKISGNNYVIEFVTWRGYKTKCTFKRRALHKLGG